MNFILELFPYELKHASRILFTQDDLTELSKLWPTFQDLFQRKSWFALVVRRFFDSTLKFSWEDKLIDLLISLEALLISEKDQS